MQPPRAEPQKMSFVEDGDKPRHAGGRPSPYDPKQLPLIQGMAYLGATDADLADALDVTISTVKLWRTKHPEFSAALKAGKDEADARVERSLYERANGYTFDSVKVFCTKDGDIIEHPIREHVPPDVTACIFWLKNRKPAEWRDQHHLDLNGKLTGELKLIASNMTPKEAAEQYALTMVDVTPRKAPAKEKLPARPGK